MNFSIGNLNGANANISSMISDLIARKSSSMNSLLEQKSSIENSLAALQNSALGTGSINNSYSSKIASLQDTIDSLKEQYSINANKLSTINSLNNSYKKTVSSLDDYIESLKNPNYSDSALTWTNSNSGVANVVINSNGAGIQRVELSVTQLATASVLKSDSLYGGSISKDTKITDLFAGKYDSVKNSITSTRSDLNENIKLSELGISSGSFKLGSNTIRVDSDDSLGDLMRQINSFSGYHAKLTTSYDPSGNPSSSFSISADSGLSLAITNVANPLSVKGDFSSDTKLSALGIKSGIYQVGSKQLAIDAKKDSVASLIEKISSLGYNASVINDPDSPGSKSLLITDATGDSVINETASNFSSIIGLTVSTGDFSINGFSFNIDSSSTLGSLIEDINRASDDGVGAKLENNKLVFVASKTGEIDINVSKGSSNFTNAIGFTIGGTMNSQNLVLGSDGSYISLTGINSAVSLSDSVSNGSFSSGNFTISYNKLDSNGVASSEMITTEISVSDSDSIDSIIQKIKNQTQQSYTDKNGNTVTTSLTAEIVDGKFQIRQTQKGAQYKISVEAGSSSFTEYVGLTQKVDPGIATTGSATTFTGINNVSSSMTFSGGNFKITASKANAPASLQSMVIDISQGESLQSVIDKINNSGLALSASIQNGKLQLIHNNYGADYSISVESGSSNFTNKVGFTSSVSAGVSNNGTNSVLTGTVSGLSSSTSAFSEGSFVLQTNALSSDGKTASSDLLSAVIEVSASDSLQSVISKINSATATYNGSEVSLGLTASITSDGRIQISQNNSGEGFDIKVEAGDSDFTQKVGLTSSVSSGISSSSSVSYIIGASAYSGSFSGGSFKISTNALDSSGKNAAFDTLSVDVNIAQGAKLDSALISSINSQINSIGLLASITSDGKIKFQQMNAGADFDIKIDAGNTDFTQKTGLTSSVNNIGILSPGRDVNQFTHLTGAASVSASTSITSGTFKINGTTINISSGTINSAISDINSYSAQTGVSAYLKDGKVVLQSNVTGSDTTIFVENGTSSFGTVSAFISSPSMAGSASIGQVGSKTTLTGAFDVSSDMAVSGGTIKINGFDIVIDASSLQDAISKINSASAKTGVSASIQSNRLVLTNTTNSTNSISVEAGTSDIAAKTGIAAFQSKKGTEELKNATTSALKASKSGLTGSEAITDSSISINGTNISFSGNINSAISAINNLSPSTGVIAFIDDSGVFTLQNIDTGNKDISVSFISGDFGLAIGAVSYSASSGSTSSTQADSWVKGGNDNLSRSSAIIGGGSLNIGGSSVSIDGLSNLGQVIDKINSSLSNVTASIEDGFFTIRKSGVSSLSVSYSGDGDFGRVTGLATYSVGSSSSSNNSYDDGYVTRLTGNNSVSSSDTLNGIIQINIDGTNYTVDFGSSSTINQAISKIQAAHSGLTAGLENGKFFIEVKNDSSYSTLNISQDSGNFGQVTGLTGYTVSSITTVPGTYTTLKGNTSFSSSATVGGTIQITKNGTSKTVSFGSSTSIDDAISKINALNAGYTASKVYDGNNQYHLEIKSTTTGNDSISVSMTSGDTYDNAFGKITGFTDYQVYHQDVTPGSYTTITGNKNGYDQSYTGKLIINKNGSKTTVDFGNGMTMDEAIAAINSSNAGVRASKEEFYYNEGTESSPIYATGMKMVITSTTTGNDSISFDSTNSNFGAVSGLASYKVHHDTSTPGSYTTLTGNVNISENDYIVGKLSLTKNGVTTNFDFGGGRKASEVIQTITNSNAGIKAEIINGKMVLTSKTLGADVITVTSDPDLHDNNDDPYTTQLGGSFGRMTGLDGYRSSVTTGSEGTYTTLTGKTDVSWNPRISGSITINKNGQATKIDLGADQTIDQVIATINSSNAGVKMYRTSDNKYVYLASDTTGADTITVDSSLSNFAEKTGIGSISIGSATSSQTSGGKTYTVTGGVTGLTRDTKFLRDSAGVTFGIYNYGVVSVSGDTIGDVIDAINAFDPSKGVTASLDSQGRFVLTSTNSDINFEYNGSLAVTISQDTSDLGRVTGLNSYTTGKATIGYTTEISESLAVSMGYTVIKTASDLSKISNDLSGKYILMNDIDLSGVKISFEEFKGELNGNGFKIKNYTNDRSLFNVLNGATIKNLTMENVDISNSTILAIGGIAANAKNSRIEGSSVSGNIRGNMFTGGIVGYVTDSTVLDHVTSSANIYGKRDVGGIAGAIQDATITSSGSTGSIYLETTFSCSTVGGLVGMVSGNKSVVENSYSYASVRGDTSLATELFIGGLVGYLYQGELSQSLQSGTVTDGAYSNSNYVGMLVGSMAVNTSVIDVATFGRFTAESTYQPPDLIGYNSNLDGVINCTIQNIFDANSDQSAFKDFAWNTFYDVWDVSDYMYPKPSEYYPDELRQIVGSKVPGLTADSKLSGFIESDIYLGFDGIKPLVDYRYSSDTVGDLLDSMVSLLEMEGHSAGYTIIDGQIIFTTDAYLSLSDDGSGILSVLGLSTTAKTFASDFTYKETSGSTYTITGAKVAGLTENSLVAGATTRTVTFDAAQGAGQFDVLMTDTVADILNKVKASFEAVGHRFDWSIVDGQITIVSDQRISLDGPGDNPWDWMGLRNGVDIPGDPSIISTGTEDTRNTVVTEHASNYTESVGTAPSTNGWDETIDADCTVSQGRDEVNSSWYESKGSNYSSTTGTDEYQTGGNTEIAADFTKTQRHDYRDEYVLTGAYVAGMMSSTVFSGMTSTIVNFNFNGNSYSVSHGVSDSVSSILDKIRNKVLSSDSSASFEWTINNGRIEITTDKQLSFSSSDKNSFVNLSGLSSSTTTYYSNYTDGGYAGDSTLRGSVSGFSSSTQLGGINEGSYTIKQGSSNAYTFSISAGDTLQDVINRINNNSAYTASLDSQGRFVIEASTPERITVTSNGDGIFDQYVGFNSADISGSTTLNRGKEGNVMAIGSVSGLESWQVLGGLTSGTFTISQNGTTTINISSSDTMKNVIDKINNTGKYTAALDSRGRLTIMSKEDSTTSLSFGGTSSFAGIAGFKAESFTNSASSVTGSYDRYSTLTGTARVNSNMTFSEGNFILSLGSNSQEFHVTEGETITSLMNKINNSSLGVSASIQNNKLVFTAKNPGSSEIRIKDGTSNFAELTGFIASGNSQVNSVEKGVLSTYTSVNTASSAQNQGISAGSFFVHLTDNNGNITSTAEIHITKNESINSIIEKINGSGLGVTASINDSGKMVITRNSSATAGGVLVTRGSSDFTNKIGFTSGGYQSASTHSGSYASITSNNSVSSSKRFSKGDFTLNLTGQNSGSYNIQVSENDSIETIIQKINALNMGATASLDSNNRLVISRDADSGEGGIEVIKGSSDFTNVIGLTSGGSQTPYTTEGVTAKITSLSSVSSSKHFSNGNFTIRLTGENAGALNIDVSSTDTINDIVNKINSKNAGVTAFINADKKLVIQRDADMGAGSVEIEKGSSNFTNEMGFTSGGDAIVDDRYGSSATITGSTPVNSAEAGGYTSGNFFIQMYNKDGSKGQLIKIDITNSGINGAVDSVSTIVDTINSKNAGITASIVNGKFTLTRDQDQAAGSFQVIKGSSDFTNKIGLTSGGIYSGSTTQGQAATQTVVSSTNLDDLLVRDSMTLGSIGINDGTFRINGVDIQVRSSDTIYDLTSRINSVFSDPKYADSKVIASYESGELVIRTKQASSTARIEIETGSSNFTEISGLTRNYKNSSDLGITDIGQNAHFNINGTDYDMALDLNDITDDGIYNGNNLIYLDRDGNVTNIQDDAAVTIELKKTGDTVIDIGNNLVNDSVSKLQSFVNKFNAAMDASANPIMSDDTEFAAFINKIKSALTSNVGDYNKITQQLADIGIVLKVAGGSNSNMGSVHMSLSKTDGKYDYVEAFYKNPSKVFDIILGDSSQPLDYSQAGVFTRLSDTLHNALENNRNGYFKVTPRSIDAQQKAIKKEITSTTFDLNQLKNTASGNDSTEGLSEYLKQLEQQYLLINDAINSLNKQYSNSMTKLILNKNNSSFNPIV